MWQNFAWTHVKKNYYVFICVVCFSFVVTFLNTIYKRLSHVNIITFSCLKAISVAFDCYTMTHINLRKAKIWFKLINNFQKLKLRLISVFLFFLSLETSFFYIVYNKQLKVVYFKVYLIDLVQFHVFVFYTFLLYSSSEILEIWFKNCGWLYQTLQKRNFWLVWDT